MNPRPERRGVVLDASITLAWCFEDEHSETAERVLARVQADGALVPPLWQSEVVNVLVVAERRGRITGADTAHFLGLFDRLPIEPVDHEPPMAQIAAVAREHGLSAYDATYLVTALIHGHDLATADRKLGEAARAAGVTVVV